MKFMDIETFLRSQVGGDVSGHGVDHALRVQSNARSIFVEEGGSWRIISAASLLHDCVDEKLFPSPAEELRKVDACLLDNGYSDNERSVIKAIITTMSWHKRDALANEPSLEQKIVTDADRLEALGAIGIIRTIEFGASRGRPFYDETNLKKETDGTTFSKPSNSTLSHFYEKLLLLEDGFYTKTGKEMAHSRSSFLRAFLREFYREIDGL
jgi:uncharacterized protein